MNPSRKISLSFSSNSPSSHPGYVLAVHRHSGAFVENIQGGHSGGCTFPTDPGVHDHAEPLLLTLIAQGCQLKRSFSGYRSRHVVKGCDVAHFADAALLLLDETTSGPVFNGALLSIDTCYLLTTHHPRGLARALGLTFIACYRFTHLEKQCEMCNIFKECRDYNVFVIQKQE